MSMKKKSSGGGANWMDTYGDMVTLLLCFFVLLYSISTIDQDKWMVFIQSFNRDAVEELNIPEGPSGQDTGTRGDDMPIPDDNNEVDVALNELYDFLVEYQQSAAAAADSIPSARGTISSSSPLTTPSSSTATAPFCVGTARMCWMCSSPL